MVVKKFSLNINLSTFVETVSFNEKPAAFYRKPLRMRIKKAAPVGPLCFLENKLYPSVEN